MVVLFAHVKVVFHTVDTETTVHYVGFLTGALAFSVAVGTGIVGAIGDRVSGKVLVHGSLVGLVGTIVVMVLTRNPYIFVPVYVAHCILAAILITIHLKTVGDLYHTDQQHGRIFGIVHALSDVGTVFGPAFIWLYTLTPVTIGPILTFLVLAGVGALSIPAFLYSITKSGQLPRP
jgi:MFS family permease